jgi:hypothetical protein
VTNDRAAFEGIQSATILKPGDRVLVVVGRDLTHRQADNMSQRLADWFPGVDFGFLSGDRRSRGAPMRDLIRRAVNAVRYFAAVWRLVGRMKDAEATLAEAAELRRKYGPKENSRG